MKRLVNSVPEQMSNRDLNPKQLCLAFSNDIPGITVLNNTYEFLEILRGVGVRELAAVHL